MAGQRPAAHCRHQRAPAREPHDPVHAGVGCPHARGERRCLRDPGAVSGDEAEHAADGDSGRICARRQSADPRRRCGPRCTRLAGRLPPRRGAGRLESDDRVDLDPAVGERARGGWRWAHDRARRQAGLSLVRELHARAARLSQLAQRRRSNRGRAHRARRRRRPPAWLQRRPHELRACADDDAARLCDRVGARLGSLRDDGVRRQAPEPAV